MIKGKDDVRGKKKHNRNTPNRKYVPVGKCSGREKKATMAKATISKVRKGKGGTDVTSLSKRRRRRKKNEKKLE